MHLWIPSKIIHEMSIDNYKKLLVVWKREVDADNNNAYFTQAFCREVSDKKREQKICTGLCN